VWEGPTWMLGGRVEQMGRTLPESRYDVCVEALGRFLTRARDGYGVTVDYFSFNEPDYGVNFRFTPSQMAAFIRRAGPKFREMGLKTRFLVGDTAGGSAAAEYCRGIMRDTSIAPYLGPIAFHCWDALSASEASYRAIAALGKETGKPVWCLEAGHDAALWQQPNPWKSWENALRTALAYERTLRLTGAEVMDYWTYQDNYPLVESDGSAPFPVFHVMAHMTDVFAPGSRVVAVETGHDELSALGTVGPGSSRAGILLVNPAGSATITISGLPAGARARIETSTAARQRRAENVVVGRAGHVKVVAPPRSVVTLDTP